MWQMCKLPFKHRKEEHKKKCQLPEMIDANAFDVNKYYQ